MQGCCRAFIYQMVFLAAAAIGLSAQTLTTFVNFDGTHGATPQSPVIQGSEGNFYGTTYGGGGGSRAYGTVYTVTPGGALTTLHSFASTDGASPIGGLVEGSDGNFYGTTSQGGTHPGAGTVFVISGGGSFAVLHNFDGTDGAGPYAGLVQGTDGNFYGTTISQGPNGYGTVFKITPAGVLTTLYAFSSGDGASPFGTLVLGTDGNFYGTTVGGGHNSNCDGLDTCGTVFKITPAGVLTTLYNFCSQTHCTDGIEPYAGLVQGADGNFYGTTWMGGTNCVPGLNGGCGTVFKITPDGTFTSLYSFCTQANCTDGKNPYYGSLVQASDGNLYGSTWLGGTATRCPNGCGTIFRITTGGSFTTVHAFTFTDGQLPYSGMIQATDGNLYGTTSSGGGHDDGTIYAFTPGIPPTPVQFVPLTPCRVVDTRNPDGTFGGPPIQGGTARSFPLPQGACGIPDTAKVYSLNVTVVPHGRLGYLTIWPTGQGQPQVSTMNSDGRIKANAAIVPAGTGGAVSVYVSDTTDVVLDINGYFMSTTPAATYEFYPLQPCRLVDTRNPNGDLGGPFLRGAVERDFPLLESPCLSGLPLQVQAYSLNVTVLPNPSGQRLGYLTVWPAGADQPAVSTLNNPTATYVANAAIVPAPPDGRIAVYPSQSTDLLVDINGYFATPGTGGMQLYPVTPCRVIDTRSGGGPPFSGELTVNVAGSTCAPSVNAQAYVLNATVIPSGRLGFLTLWPNGQPQPNVSTLNAPDGAVSSNMAIVPTMNGSIDAYASALTQLILDISGYFAP